MGGGNLSKPANVSHNFTSLLGDCVHAMSLDYNEIESDECLVFQKETDLDM